MCSSQYERRVEVTCILASIVVAGWLGLGIAYLFYEPSNESAIKARAALAWSGLATLPDVWR